MGHLELQGGSTHPRLDSAAGAVGNAVQDSFQAGYRATSHQLLVAGRGSQQRRQSGVQKQACT